jgi:hypothetical protein
VHFLTDKTYPINDDIDVLVTLGPRNMACSLDWKENCSGAGGQIGFTSIPMVKSFTSSERHTNTGLDYRAYNPEYSFHCQ